MYDFNQHVAADVLSPVHLMVLDDTVLCLSEDHIDSDHKVRDMQAVTCPKCLERIAEATEKKSETGLTQSEMVSALSEHISGMTVAAMQIGMQPEAAMAALTSAMADIAKKLHAPCDQIVVGLEYLMR